MAQRSIGLNIEILNEKRLTDVENKIKKLNENGLKIRVEGLDKLSNIQDLIANIGKVQEQLDSIYEKYTKKVKRNLSAEQLGMKINK